MSLPHTMTAEQYKALRQQLGTQAAVAALLDIDVMTIKRREKPAAKITREAALALRMLGKIKLTHYRKNGGKKD